MIVYLYKRGPSTTADNVDGLPKNISAGYNPLSHTYNDWPYRKRSEPDTVQFFKNNAASVCKHSLKLTAPFPKQMFVSL